MGNEFGHPEWIDFPRHGNGWSYRHARRQWHLLDDPGLNYRLLAQFDRDMIAMAKNFSVLDSGEPQLRHEHGDNKVIAFERAGLLFAFNFHPHTSHFGYRIDAPAGEYRLILDSDAPQYGGHGRLTAGQTHVTLGAPQGGRTLLSLYLPTRTGLVLQKWS